MDDKLFFGARSSLFVSTPALVFFAALTVVSAIFHIPAVCASAAFLFCLCLVSRLWGEAALRHVTVTWDGTPAALFPPGEVTMRLRIRNNKWLPVIWLEVVQLLDQQACLLPEQEDVCRVQGLQAQLEGVQDGEAAFLHKKFSFVMSHEDILWTSRWQAVRRGIFYPAQMKVRAGDGFGLTQSEQLVSAGRDRCVAVYPRLQPVMTDLFLQDMWEASSGAKGYLEDPTLIKSTRDYTAADSFKRINWRLTARSQQTAVNTYEVILPKSAYFLFDGESFNDTPPQTDALEDALSILTSLIMGLNDAGILCGVSLPKNQAGPAREILALHHTPLEEILMAFAGYQQLPPPPLRDGEQKPHFLPAVFHNEQILSLSNVGRFYYVCSSLEHVHGQKLLTRLDPARTVLLPYVMPKSPEDPILQQFTTVGLTTLKRGGKHGT